MRSTLVFIFLGALNLTVFGQSINFGVTGGAVLTSINVDGYNDEGTSQPSIGLTVGLFAEIYLSDYIIFQPGLNYMQKGGTWEFPSGTDKFKLNYLELPLNLLYKKGKFMAGAGPSIGFGLNGKLNSDFANGSTTSYDATFSKEGDA